MKIVISRLARTIGGLIAGALPASLTLSLFMALSASAPKTAARLIDAISKTLIINGGISLIYGFIFGLLVHVILYALKFRGLLPYALIGGLIPGAFGGMVGSVTNAPIEGFLFLFLVGLVFATTAWLIRRPDKDALLEKAIH